METRKKVPVKGFARDFLRGDPLPNGIVMAYESDPLDDKKINLKPIYTLITDKNGVFGPFDWPVGKAVSLRFSMKGYHTIQSGTIIVPEEGINHTEMVKNISFQVPSALIAVKGFAYAMNSATLKDGRIQCVVATIAEPNMTMDDLPQGCVGATAELKFHDETLQRQWLALQKRDRDAKDYNNKWKLVSRAAGLLSGLAAWYMTGHIIKSTMAAVAAGALSSILAWKFLIKVVRTFYFGVWKSGPLTHKTNPFDTELTSSSPDGGVLFNLKDLELPEEGAKFTIFVKGPNSTKINSVEGHAFPNILTNFSPPFCPTAQSMPEPSQRLMYGPSPDEKIIPKLVTKSGMFTTVAALGMYYKTRNPYLSFLTGLAMAPLSWTYLSGEACLDEIVKEDKTVFKH